MEDIKDAMIKSKVPKIFTGAVNIRNPGRIQFLQSQGVYTRGPHEESKLERDRKKWWQDDGE